MLTFHTVSGVAALLAGLATCVMTKGTRLHRRIGWLYSVSMYSLCLSSFFISADILSFIEIAGMHYGIFHVFALCGTIQLSLGLYIMIRRHAFSEPLEWHLYNMLWSVVGLGMATNSHLFGAVSPWITSPTGLSMGWGIGLTGLLLWGVSLVVGIVWIERLRPRYRNVTADAVSVRG